MTTRLNTSGRMRAHKRRHRRPEVVPDHGQGAVMADGANEGECVAYPLSSRNVCQSPS